MRGFIIAISLLFYSCLADIESNFYREEPCAAKKGFCLLKNECPGELGGEWESLCGAQKSLGAVCCSNVKAQELNCFQLHNTCSEKCPQSLTIGKKGCAGDSVCCALV
ncbi:uncharacterized protein LOC125503235 [Dendroctonus ponderosae]